MSRIVIIGAGGFGRETRELIASLWEARGDVELIGYLDDDPALAGGTVGGFPVLGSVATAQSLDDVRFVITTGSPADYFSRQRIAQRLGLPDERYATLIHPTAVVPASCSVGPGSVLHAGVILTADVAIGRHAVVMPATVLTHDDRIGDYVTFGAGVRVAGRVTVGTGAYIGSGAMIREDRSIGAWSLVGMGAVVSRDVPDAEVWAGVPARRIRSVDVPPELA